MIKYKKIRNRINLCCDYLFHRSAVRGHPISMQIEVTNHCNLNCYTCPRKNLKRQKGYMDFELFKNIIISEQDYLETVLLFHMGEPLLHPNIVDMVKFSHDKGIKTIIFTNGTLLFKEKAEQLFINGLDLLVVSFDGYEKETYEEVRKGSSYDTVLENIENAVIMNSELNNSTKIQLHYVVSKKTSKETELFYKMFKKYKALDLRIKPFINTGNMGEELGEKVKPRKKYPCFMLYREPVIGWDGKMFPCCVDLLGEKVVGDINNDSIESAWNSKPMQLMRKRHNQHDFGDEPLCKYCNAYCMSKLAYIGVIFLHDYTIRKMTSKLDAINLKNKLGSLFQYVK